MTQTTAFLGEHESETTDIMIDSGSDITLISSKALDSLTTPVKVKAGQRINLVQVTGNAKISGYTPINLFVPTSQGKVKMPVEAYVVKGMTTPFILGNDFADQYSLSILWDESKCELQFGNSGIHIQLENSTGPGLVDDQGHTFKVAIGSDSPLMRRRLHKKQQRRCKMAKLILKTKEI